MKVDLAEGTEYLLALFHTLSGTRGFSEAGPLPISHQEIHAYTELRGFPIDMWELEALENMDAAFIEEAYALRSAQVKASQTRIGERHGSR